MVLLEATPGDFVHRLDEVMDSLNPVILGGIFLTWGLFCVGAFVRHVRKRGGRPLGFPRALIIIGAVGFFTIGIVSTILYNKIERKADDEIAAVLQGTPKSIKVDGTLFVESAALFDALADMRTHDYPGGHTPLLPDPYELVIETSTGRLTLQLLRNARYPREYVVLYPAYLRTRTSPVGHIATAALDSMR